MTFAPPTILHTMAKTGNEAPPIVVQSIGFVLVSPLEMLSLIIIENQIRQLVRTLLNGVYF